MSGVNFYFEWGLAPVAVAAQAMPFERKLAMRALHARVEKEMPKSVPVTADEANLIAGAQVYEHHCGMCHGSPGSSPSPLAEGMFPKPPPLFRAKGVTDDPPGET
jgi:thiosulfate dehydrogenase